MLELISITQEVIQTQAKGQEEEAEHRLRANTDGTVAVLIIPSLSPALLKYLNEETCYYKVNITCYSSNAKFAINYSLWVFFLLRG